MGVQTRAVQSERGKECVKLKDHIKFKWSNISHYNSSLTELLMVVENTLVEKGTRRVHNRI